MSESWSYLEDTVREVKKLRAELTEIVERIRRVQEGVGAWVETLPGKRHAALAITHTEDARLRLGEVLRTIGEGCPGLVKNPYPTSQDPAVGTIDPTASEIRCRTNPDDVSPRPG